MNTIYGESEVYSYEDVGGISLYEAPPSGAIVGSGNDPGEGTSVSVNRIKWWVWRSPEGIFSGGITGGGWYTEPVQAPYEGTVNGPFVGYNEQDIYAYAWEHQELDAYFKAWNDAHADKEGDTTITGFIAYIQHHGDPSCAISGGAG